MLTTLLARFDIVSDDPLADGFIQIEREKKGSVVSIDPDGFGAAEAQSLVSVSNVAVEELNNLNNFSV